MSLLPKEHGAYGQITFPLVTAFAVAGVSTAGLLFAAAVVAGFLAHEPGAVLLGLRGGRASRELRRPALRWLAFCLTIGAAAGTGALLTTDPAARWSIAVPLVPACVLAIATARGRDKSWQGEVTAAVAFSGAAVPVSMAAGASAETAAAVAIPFALLFSASTLAVRVVILRVRRSGDPRAAYATRRAALALAGGATVALVVAIASDHLSPSVLTAAGPGLLTAAVVATHPPSPTRLRTLGWALIGVSVVTAGLVVLTA
jgi:YwiC-like protein